MTHSEICKVCCGSGRYKKDGEKSDIQCHGCAGLGWVTVQDNINQIRPDLNPYKKDKSVEWEKAQQEFRRIRGPEQIYLSGGHIGIGN